MELKFKLAEEERRYEEKFNRELEQIQKEKEEEERKAKDKAERES